MIARQRVDALPLEHRRFFQLVPGKRLHTGDLVKVRYKETGTVVEATFLGWGFGIGTAKLWHEAFALDPCPDNWEVLE